MDVQYVIHHQIYEYSIHYPSEVKKNKKMSESEMNMPLPPHSPSPSPSPSTPPSQLNPTAPEIYTRYTPKLVKRMQADTCYRCHQKGHWSWDCPLKSPNTKSLSPSPNHDSLSPQKIWCRCGHGYCEVKTANNDRNPGRKYYACPIKRGRRCKEFVKWCDDPINDSYLQPPLYKYPECECGAGVCRKVKGTQSPVKYYFACPVGEDHGSCGYQVWEEQLLDNKSIVPIQDSSQRTLLEFWEDNQNKRTNNKGDDLLVVHSKRMRIMDNYENPSYMAVSELAEREDAAPKTAPSKGVGFPEFEVSEDLQYPDLSWDATEDEASLLSRQSTPSRIYCQQNVFQRHIFAVAVAVADASFGQCPMGWLGRLLFFNPTQSLKFPPPQPFFCCIFPSFNSIVVPKQATIRDVPCGECNQLAISNLSQCVQLSTGCHTEVSRDVGNPNKSPGRERKPMSKAERQRQVVSFAQQQLLIELETLDSNDHESMREAAEATFAVLDNLEVDYKQFSEHVLDFVNFTSSVAEMDKSMENFLSLGEYGKRFEEEKVRFAHIQDECFKTEALLEVSNQHRQSLREEISHLQAILHEKQSQLESCELETLNVETHLGDIKKSMLEADKTLKVTAEEAEVAKKLIEERKAKQMAAKTALEKAKLELEN